jgi:hypothetical protein
MSPGDPVEVLRRADAFCRQRQPAAAIKLYRELLAGPTEMQLRYAALLGMARALADEKRFAEAEAACREASELNPANPIAFALQALALRDLSRLEDAAQAIASARERSPGNSQFLNISAAIALKRGRANEGLVFAEAALALDTRDQRALSDRALSLAALGRRDESMQLLDFVGLVKIGMATAPAGYRSLEAFNAELVEVILQHPDLCREEDANTLVRGSRLSDSFTLPLSLADGLREIFLAATRAYAADIDAPVSHPVMAGRPARFELTSWANVMERSAFERPHIHESGWVSGVYYPEMPNLAAGQGDAGALIFGGHPYGETLSPLLPGRAILPACGQVILFPSYFYHATAPFDAAGRRISIAFDVARHKAV